MKAFLFIVVVYLMPLPTFAVDLPVSKHLCEISYLEQVVELSTKKQTWIKAKSDSFEVSKSEKLENQKRIIQIKKEDGQLLQNAEVTTGTYLESAEGDIIQAYASTEILNKKEDVGVVAHIENKFSRASRAVTEMKDGKLHAINFNLKCYRE
jgi:hypothetical protein